MASRKKQALALVAALPLVIIVSLAIMSFSARQPDNLGLRDGHLAPCPTSPNAVSTEATDSQHQMPPIALTGSTEDAIERLKEIVSEFPNAKIITASPDYLHVEFTSKIFRFVDDVEFHGSEADHCIHFRSASRTGRSDFGVNRARMNKITAAYTKSQP